MQVKSLVYCASLGFLLALGFVRCKNQTPPPAPGSPEAVAIQESEKAKIQSLVSNFYTNYLSLKADGKQAQVRSSTAFTPSYWETYDRLVAANYLKTDPFLWSNNPVARFTVFNVEQRDDRAIVRLGMYPTQTSLQDGYLVWVALRQSNGDWKIDEIGDNSTNPPF